MPSFLRPASRAELVALVVDYMSLSKREKDAVINKLDKPALTSMLADHIHKEGGPNGQYALGIKRRLNTAPFQRLAKKYPNRPDKPDAPKRGKGLTARQMLKSTPRNIHENAKFVKVTSLKQGRSKHTRKRFSIVATTTEPDKATEEQPHRQRVDILTPGLRDVFDARSRLHVWCDCSYFKYYCVEANQKVLVEEGGQKPISMVRPGEMVMTLSGEWREVLAHELTGYRDCVLVSLESGRRIKVTPDHRLYACFPPGIDGAAPSYGWREAGGLSAGDLLAVAPWGGFPYNLQEDGVALDRVASVADAGKGFVYDMAVDRDRNFVAQGMFAHNCEVALAKHGASSVKASNGKWPRITNPRGKTMVCKHLVSLFMHVKRKAS